ncbi:MAG: hypothetical protein AAF654_06015 [Myxococcota bacterium]
MSDYYRLNFAFALPAYGPDSWPAVFKALARNREPSPDALQTLPPVVRDYLSKPSYLGFGAYPEKEGSAVELRRQETAPATAYHPKSPEWDVRFSLTMHDDEYGNGGFLLWMLMHTVVGENGLYCTMFTESQKDTVTHFYKSDEDIIRVHLDAPFTRYWVPPEFPKTWEELSPSAQRPDLSTFRVAEPFVVTPENRADALRAHEDMLRG